MTAPAVSDPPETPTPGAGGLEVAVVIVTFRSAGEIARCLRSVLANTTVSHRVVVVDNASDDGSADLVATQFPGVQLLRNRENVGFARAANQGAAACDSRYVLLLNPDTEFRSAAIDELVAAAGRRPAQRIYGGRTVHEDGSVDPWSAWGLPRVWSLLMFASGLSTVFRGHALFDPESLGPWPRDTEREVEAISGCLQLIDRTLWDALGGMDERYFVYGEDADWALRARRAGARPLLVPSAEIRHDGGASSTSEDKRVMVLRGKATLIRLHWGAWRPLGLALLMAGTALRGPLAGGLLRLLGRPGDASWMAAWVRRREWLAGW